MRYDSKKSYLAVPFKWFTWGYVLINSRWLPYFILRLPGKAYEYSIAHDDYRWGFWALAFRRLQGFHMVFVPKEVP